MIRTINLGIHGESGEGSVVHEVRQSTVASISQSSLPVHLMEQICHRDNMNQAYQRVKGNRGSAGVDGMKVDDLNVWLKAHKVELLNSLLNGSYQPQAVRRVSIPKPNGGSRELGIPTVVDRLVQQAILQVLTPILDPTFSDSSFGFRPKRSAHQAVRQAKRYVSDDRPIVVDIDLEKFFDRVNHDMLMSRLSKRIADKRLLGIVRRFLSCDLMVSGVYVRREEGTPQGGPLSPLLANLLLDDLDKELERRGHKFCRYADDCNIYVSSLRAGERVYQSIKKFLLEKLKLKVNEQKSAVAYVNERKFLGFKLQRDSRISLSPESIKRVKSKIYMNTRRTIGREVKDVAEKLDNYLQGWLGYFSLIETPSQLKEIDSWMRRRFRCLKLKQKKRSYTIAPWLIKLGIDKGNAWNLAASSKGWWRLSRTPQIHQALNNQWFKELGLCSLYDEYVRVKG